MDDRQRLEIELSAPIDGDWTWGELEDQARSWYGMLNEALEAMDKHEQAKGGNTDSDDEKLWTVRDSIRQQLSPTCPNCGSDDPSPTTYPLSAGPLCPDPFHDRQQLSPEGEHDGQG